MEQRVPVSVSAYQRVPLGPIALAARLTTVPLTWTYPVRPFILRIPSPPRAARLRTHGLDAVGGAPTPSFKKLNREIDHRRERETVGRPPSCGARKREPSRA
jgi:hypothetical protein